MGDGIVKRADLKRRTELKRGRGPKRKLTMRQKSRARARRGVPQGQRAPGQQVFWEAARDQGRCAVSGYAGRDWQAHHVVERQELHRRREDEWDPRNALRLKRRVHEQHTIAKERIPLKCLTDENIRYAVELMGVAAHPYLKRYYSGHDERLELAIAELGAPDAAG